MSTRVQSAGPIKHEGIALTTPKDVIEIGFGLGAHGGHEEKDKDCDALFKQIKNHCDAARNDEATMPIVHKAVWRFGGPITSAQALLTFGPDIDFTDPDAAGALETYSTAGYKGGRFQTNVLILGVGLHAHVPQVTTLVRGNAYPASTYAAPAAPSFSPDVYTVTDGTAASGAWGASQIPTMPAFADMGEWARSNMRNLALGWNMRWTVGSQRNVLDEILIDIMHMIPDTMQGASGLQQQEVISAINAMNAYYVSPTTPGLNSTQVFRGVDTIRLGAAGAGGAGQFSPSLDLAYPDVSLGGVGVAHKLMCNERIRRLKDPFMLSAAVDAGLICQQNSSILGNAFRNGYDANYGFSGTVPVTLTEYANFLSTGTTAFKERTLDGLSVSQQMPSGRIPFKYGRTQFDLIVYGYEFGEYAKSLINANPKLRRCLATECGMCLGWNG